MPEATRLIASPNALPQDGLPTILRTVLAIDDEDITRTFDCDCRRTSGYIVETVGSAEEAILILRQTEIHCILRYLQNSP